MHKHEFIDVYNRIILNLFNDLIARHGSITAAAKYYNVCRFNLSRILNKKQMISVSLFNHLNNDVLLRPGANVLPDISLLDYLCLNHDLTQKNIQKILIK